MDTAEVIYLGEFRCEATHLQSGSKIITDAPTDNFGKGEAFSPTDLMAMSLGSCIMTTIAIQTRLMGFDLINSKLTVKKHMASDPRRVAKISIDVKIPKGNLTDEDKEKIIIIGLNCPVAKSLHPDLVQDINFQFV
ncbi:MAG: OsmC family protein [Bacteroidota bacterium]